MANSLILKGDFNKLANINGSLANGYKCVVGISDSTQPTYSHAEGYDSKVDNNAKYSHADGYKAEASHSYAYVWSGKQIDDYNRTNGNGTYSIYTNSYNGDSSSETVYDTNGLHDVYINGKTLHNFVKEYASYYANKLFTTNTEVEIKSPLSINGKTLKIYNSGKFNVDNKSDVTIDGNMYMSGSAVYNKVLPVTSKDSTIANTKFVDDRIKKYLNRIFQIDTNIDIDDDVSSTVS